MIEDKDPPEVEDDEPEGENSPNWWKVEVARAEAEKHRHWSDAFFWAIFWICVVAIMGFLSADGCSCGKTYCAHRCFGGGAEAACVEACGHTFQEKMP